MSIQEYLDNFVVLSDTEFAKLNQEERIYYQHSVKHYRDLRNSLKYAREEGFKKGLEKAKQQKAIEIAKKFISMKTHLSFEDIADITELSIEEIKEIANSLKK